MSFTPRSQENYFITLRQLIRGNESFRATVYQPNDHIPTYLFGRGDGQDTISSYDWTQPKQDVLQFKDGVTAADVAMSRESYDLILKIAGTQDQVMVQNYFPYYSGLNPYGIESIRFADGTSLAYADVKDVLLAATEGADTLNGFSTDDILSGLGGNDSLNGSGGNDTLEGGAGNDFNDGGYGDDTYA